MSKLKNELTAIREALDTEHEYSGDYALQEEVANIRKLVENGAGGESVGGSLIVTAPEWALDKTWNEIAEAIRSGKGVYYLQDYSENGVTAYPCLGAQMDEGATKPYIVTFMYMLTAAQAAELRYSSATADGALEPAGGD